MPIIEHCEHQRHTLFFFDVLSLNPAINFLDCLYAYLIFLVWRLSTTYIYCTWIHFDTSICLPFSGCLLNLRFFFDHHPEICLSLSPSSSRYVQCGMFYSRRRKENIYLYLKNDHTVGRTSRSTKETLVFHISFTNTITHKSRFPSSFCLRHFHVWNTSAMITCHNMSLQSIRKYAVVHMGIELQNLPTKKKDFYIFI